MEESGLKAAYRKDPRRSDKVQPTGRRKEKVWGSIDLPGAAERAAGS